MSIKNILSCELLLHAHEIETLEQLILNGADLNYQAENGWCLLFEFVSLNLHKELKHFANKNLNIHMKDYKGRTALFWAIYHNHVECVKTLLDLNYNIHAEVFPSLPPLHYAVYKNSSQIVKLLIASGIDVNHEDNLEQSASAYAQIYEREEMIDLLKSHGAVNLR